MRLGVAQPPFLVKIEEGATVGELLEAIATQLRSSVAPHLLQVFLAKRDDAWLLEDSDEVEALTEGDASKRVHQLVLEPDAADRVLNPPVQHHPVRQKRWRELNEILDANKRARSCCRSLWIADSVQHRDGFHHVAPASQLRDDDREGLVFNRDFKCSAHSANGALVCAAGAFFNGHRCQLCPGGTYGDRPGLVLSTCSGKCSAGHFCPDGSTSPYQNLCGTSVFYCPAGSAMRQRLAEGYYTLKFPEQIPTQNLSAIAQTACEPGYYCVFGIRRACPAGRFGQTIRLKSVSCTDTCPVGFYCPVATPLPIPCPAGTYGNVTGLSSSNCNGPCPLGHYCPVGTIVPMPCPSGTFGNSTGLKTKECSFQCEVNNTSNLLSCLPSPCPRGYHCPLGTTTPLVCGNTGLYCPEGSSTPTLASVGSYTIWTPYAGPIAPADLAIIAAATVRTGNPPDRMEDAYVDGNALALQHQMTRSDQKRCENGTYCVAGVKRFCPEGVYGATEGLSTAQCTAPCPAGYFCPLGTSSYLQHPCTSRTVFCRQGSAKPTSVSTGYFTVLSSFGSLRIDQTICPPGSYCVDGIQSQCPAGTYGSSSGLATPECSGRCQKGYTCPMGSISATQTPCPAGSYSWNGLTCAPCAPGFWCDAGSPDPKQHECGSDTAYCPLGSGAALSVSTGYYAAGQTPTTHSSQLQCVVQNVQHLPQCPTRTVGVNSGL